MISQSNFTYFLRDFQIYHQIDNPMSVCIVMDESHQQDRNWYVVLHRGDLAMAAIGCYVALYR